MITKVRRFVSLAAVWTLLASLTSPADAQPTAAVGPAFPTGGREFPIGSLSRFDQLPPGRLRAQLAALSPPAQDQALRWLRSFHFTEADLPSLHADAAGGILYACGLTAAGSATVNSEPPPLAAAAVPVSPFPASLVFHSKPGAVNVLYLNFIGETVTDTQWNTEISRAVIPAVAFSTDSDLTTFSDAEQVVIKRIWERMAEDYAPFNIDVTTERPASLTTRTAMALITRNTDANGAANPFSTAGGVAYVNVFGTSAYASYRPAWIYHNNLYNIESYIAEAASHEIGHNMGLSHDGKTDGTEYYGGHGADDVSWGPLMGTGYNRNVSQWSKGEYYLANNAQDDLATIAGKLTYRTDDHGGTPGTATGLVVTGGTNIVATTPESDPANTNPANKGVIERNTDLDVFSFVAGTGPVSLSVNPWIMPAGTRGGNVDLLVELYNEAGTLLATNNPALQTTALIQTNLVEGRYYLYVRNSGGGDPFNSTPTGYTVYGSIGQYFITGYLTEATTFIAPPVAELQITDLTQSGQTTKEFTVTYSDDVAIDAATIDSNDVRVTGPNGYDQLAQFVALNVTGNGTPRTATYAVSPAAGGVWLPADNATYTLWMRTNQVSDTEGAWVAAGQLGQFQVAVPVAVYAASMDVDPGWTLEPQWQYGTPTYTSGGPTSGFTGTKIIAYNLGGDYANRLSVKYATTPPINCSGSTTLTLRFKRWLCIKPNDTASIQVSTNGTTWVDVWSTSRSVFDSAWQELQYPLPAGVAGSPSVRLRWGLASNQNQSDIGWNIDDVELLGNGTLDTTPPMPTLSVASLTLGGSPSHSCSVSYTDDTAVRLSSLDSTDLVVTGPNGYSNLVEFVGADLPSDGSPITATYSIPAPGGAWDAADNGIYTITLLDDAVEDILNNIAPQTMLGTYDVSISIASPGVLAVLPAGGLTSAGPVGGPFSPASIIYTLTNSGGSTLTWTASKTQDWVSLSSTSGSLAAGASASVTVSIGAAANALAAAGYSDTVSFVNTTTGSGNTGRGVSLTVNSLGMLAVLPAGGLTSVGPVGGPFSPASIVYTLTNSGGSTLSWTASKTQDWVSLSSTSGSLVAGASASVTVSIAASANTLAAAGYNDTVSFVNTSTGSGNTGRSVSLTVNSLRMLAVLPAGGLTSAGPVGGPFSPVSIVYTLTNSGSSSLTWSAGPASGWVSLSISNGTLAAAESATVTVSLNSAASALVAGNYTNAVSFVNETAGGNGVLRSVQLTVNPIPAVLAGGWLEAGSFQVSLTGEPLRVYVIECSTNFADWVGIFTNVVSASGTLDYLDSESAQSRTRFYRARQLPK